MAANSANTKRAAIAFERARDALTEARAYIVLNAPDLVSPQCQRTLRAIDAAQNSIAAAK